MTEVAFHFNAPDKLAYACRLLRKAAGSGAKVVVTAPPVVLDRLDVLLWTFSSGDFVPHARQPGEPRVLAASPIILSETVADSLHRQVLLNLGAQVPAGFEVFERLIEVVSLHELDRQQARGRWKHYAGLGYAITRHDLVLKETH
jgi:DNA polymerase-3 subunit chi